jgi:hypothetical protein
VTDLMVEYNGRRTDMQNIVMNMELKELSSQKTSQLGETKHTKLLAVGFTI